MAISNQGNLNSAVNKLLTETEATGDGEFFKKKKGENNKSKMVWLGFSVYSTPGKRGIMKQWDQEFVKAEKRAKRELEATKRAKSKGQNPNPVA